MIVWSIAQCVLVVELYRVLLLAKLLTPQVIPTFSNTDEMITLIASGQYHMVTEYMGNWSAISFAMTVKLTLLTKAFQNIMENKIDVLLLEAFQVL
jgi:hypothetical protein